MGAKNLHLEHLEDEIINQGIDGGRGAVNFLRGLRDMLKGNSKSKVNMTVKWDGAPALFVGKHPETNQFFVAKKSLFTKDPKFYTSEQQIKDAKELSGDLETKFLEAFKHLSKLSFKNILQGDLMFTSGDKKTKNIDGKSYITFQPNTILYAVDEDSDLGSEIRDAKFGIVFHTTYKGSTIDGLSASFGVNLKGLGHSKDIWVDDATYKDVSGTGNMTAKETLTLTQSLSVVGKSFHGITKNDLGKFMKIQKTMTSKGAAGATYKTYHNALIRSGTYNPTPEGYLNHVEVYWRDKVVGKLKKQQNIDVKVEIGEQIMSELKGLKKLLINLTKFQGYLVKSKQLIINALNRVKSIGTFKKTDKGFEAVNPEGYVAIDRQGKAVKLVDRMEFAFNNFTAAKQWDK